METKRDGRPAAQPGSPPGPGHRLHGGARRRPRPHQPRIRRPVRPAAPDHPGRNPRGSPRRRHPPRAASRHRRRRGHPRHHPRGAPRLPGLLPDPRRSGRCTGQSRTAPVGAPRRRRTRHRIAKGRTQGMTDLRTSRGRRSRAIRRSLGHPIRRTLANREFTWHSQSLHQVPGIRRTTDGTCRPALAGPGRGGCRPADGGAGLHHRQHRAAVGAAGAGVRQQ